MLLVSLCKGAQLHAVHVVELSWLSLQIYYLSIVAFYSHRAKAVTHGGAIFDSEDDDAFPEQ